MAATDIAEVLHDHGHRVTRPRRAVWRELVAADSHLTVEELAGRIEQQAGDGDRGVDLASVYRSLALFEELGLVRQSRLGDEDAGRWELAHPDEHFHLVCRECGAVTHHQGTLVDQVATHLRDNHDFEPDTIELVVTGRCDVCRDGA